jgi:single-stranded DNA-specific DHH superfamily exonuclease
VQAEQDLTSLEDALEEERKKLEEAMSANRIKIVQLQGTLLEDKVIVTYEGRLKLCLDAFYTGWIKYLCHKGEDISPCEQTFRTFIGSHFTQAA